MPIRTPGPLGNPAGYPPDAILGGGMAPPRIPWSQNPMVTALGSSLLAGRGTLSGAGQVLGQMAPAVMNAKFGMQEAMQKRQEEAAKRARMNNIIKAWPNLSPEQRTLFMEQPELFAQYAASSMTSPEPTDDMREYAAGLADPAFAAHQEKMRRAGASNFTVGPTGIDYGPAGEGRVWQTKTNPQTGKPEIVLDERGAPIAIPFQGGKAWAEEQAAADKTGSRQESKELKGDIVLDDIDRALAEVKANPDATTGIAGWAMPNLPIPSPAKRVAGFINTAKSNISIDNLQIMREQSPTGGALGNVSDKDLAILQGVYGDLEQSTDPATFTYNLKRLRNSYLDIIHGEGKGPPREAITAPPPMSQADPSGPAGPPAISPGTVIENESTGQKHTMKPDGTWDPPL